MSEAGATFFDGRTATPHRVRITLEETSLAIAGDGVAETWPLAELRSFDAPKPFLRLGHEDEAARIETDDEIFAARLREAVPDLDRRGRLQRGGHVKLVLWSIAAGISVLLVAIFGVPALAVKLAPLVPLALEARIGAAVEDQVASLLDAKAECIEPEGVAALQRLTARMTEGVTLPAPVRVTVRRSSQANALALPAGRIVILSDLIDKSKSGDEFAGVLAHELGHVAHRDPIRSLIAAGGTSFLLSMILGDLTGSTIIIALGQAVIAAGYSRDAERAADAYGVDMMKQSGGNGAALASILERIAGEEHKKEDATDFLRSHPYTKERSATIRARAGESGADRRILSDEDWQYLRKICSTTSK